MRTGAVLLCCALLACCASAMITKGRKSTTDQTTYIGRFAFSIAHGTQKGYIKVHYKVNGENYGEGSHWAVYYDTHWYGDFHNKTATCSEKVAKATDKATIVKSGDEEMTYIVPLVEFTRPHIWFVALMNCPEEQGGIKKKVDVSYRIEWINMDGSHIGYDQVGLKAMYACFFVFFFVLALVHAFGDVFLWLRNSFHTIVRLLLAALVLMMFANMFNLIHWAKYEGDGMGCSGCATFAGLLDNAAYIVFTLLLTMIASGWAITTQTLTRRWWVLGLFVADAVTIIILFIINNSGSGEDRAANINTIYELSQTWGSAFIVFTVFYLIAWGCTIAYFCFAVWTSYKEETQYDKRLFYFIFGTSYLVWFISVPLFSIIAIAVDAWLRQKMMAAIHEVISFIGMAVLVVLLWPTFVYKYFRIISPDLLSDNPSGL